MPYTASSFLERLKGIQTRAAAGQLMFALGELLMSLEEAAAANITLNEEHLALVTAIRVNATPSYSMTLGLGYSWGPSYSEMQDLIPIDRFVPRALSVLKELRYSTETLAEVYDDDADLRDALATLLPDFEYPDISHLTIDQLRARCAREHVAARPVPA